MNGTGEPCGSILIVEDDCGMLALLEHVLGEAGFATVGVETGEDALIAAQDEPPDVAILDVHLPGISGYHVCRELRDRLGMAVRILFISGERTESFDRVAGLLLGADDYLTKPFAPDELVARVRALVRRGASPTPGRLARLTPRELEVLGLLAEGGTQKQIAAQLVISPSTVGTHVERIFEKLGVHNRTQAAALVLRAKGAA